ncbi:MAG TPA: class III extradiol dioxygenase family protein [Steroidobacteraceae bacterium]|nr:class III extradiol dioxygenase family protein [Steroidobacteraceae bacterium]
MARLLGAICTSHVPAIGKAIARGLEREPYWQPFFQGFPPVHAWLEEVRPDVAVIIYNDHGLNFFLDKLPTFAVGAAAQYANADEGWGLPTVAPFPGDVELSWHLIESLVAAEFDITMCQEMLVDHAFAVPMQLLWPTREAGARLRWPVRTVPVCVNTVQHPLPSALRCYKLGQAIGRAIESYPEDARVVVIGTGGLSHQLDGTRAGFINKRFDELCMGKLVNEPEALTRYSNAELVELAGTQGVEILMWIAARATLAGPVTARHRNYHVPISNTASGLMLLEQAA